MNKFAKLIEDYLIEVYLKGEPLNSSSKEFQIGFQKRMIQEFENNELNELLIKNHYKNRKLKLGEPFSKERKMDFYNNKYIPFLKSIKNKIDKNRLEKHQEEIDKIRLEYNLCVNQSCQEEVEKLKKQSIDFKSDEKYQKDAVNFGLDEKKLNEILVKDIKHLNDNYEFLRLIPEIQLLEKSNVIQTEQINNLVEEFNDVYERNKSQLLEHEIEVFKIHLELIIYIPTVDYRIPGRDEERQKVKDIFAILLILV